MNKKYTCYCGLYCENCAVKEKVEPASKMLYEEMKKAGFEDIIHFIPDGGGSEGWSQGQMWLDAKTNTLYWTNHASYPAGGNLPSLPSTYWAKINFENATVYDRQGRRLPDNRGGAPFGVFANSFTAEYLGGGAKLCIGFGGCSESIVSVRSLGPLLSAVSLDAGGDITADYFNCFMYYPHDARYNATHCIRDGNYLTLQEWNIFPSTPWEGRWTNRDAIRTGVFIDYKGKKGYMTFVSQVTGRSAYDFAGTVFFSKTSESLVFLRRVNSC